jgi:hypothetical protein
LLRLKSVILHACRRLRVGNMTSMMTERLTVFLALYSIAIAFFYQELMKLKALTIVMPEASRDATG